jgi:hypothetical protein
MVEMASVQFDYTAFDRRDLKTGRWKCRLCEKPSKPPKIFYCSDECSNLFQLALSWPAARYRTIKRDENRCVKCGKVVGTHYSEYDYEKREFVYHNEIANAHHIIPVKYLWGEIQIALEGLEGKERTYRAQQLKSIVLFHSDNLITLCEKHHKEAHKSGWYDKFKFLETGQKTLEEMMIND